MKPAAQCTQRQGRGRAGVIFSLALISLVVFALLKFLPPRIDHGVLHDRVLEECRFAGDPRRTTDVMKGNIWEAAREQGLDRYFDAQDILVEKGSSWVHVRLAYERPVELLGWVYVWRLRTDVKRPLYG